MQLISLNHILKKRATNSRLELSRILTEMLTLALSTGLAFELLDLEAKTHDGYDFLNKIEVLREDVNEYIFSKADFKSVNLNDIEYLFIDRMMKRHEP
ncbi:hypothetical protein Tco_1060602 [Tanacetum coccineum]